MDIEEHDIAGGALVPQVVLDLLVVPLELSGVYIESDDAIGVQVVPATVHSVEVVVRIAGAEDDEAEFRIDRGRRPYRQRCCRLFAS
jgi:hypothetical protein